MGWVRRYRKRVRRAGRELGRQLTSALRPWRAAPRPGSPADRRDRAGRARLAEEVASVGDWLATRPELSLAITCAGRLDGAGGQALAVMSALAFAHNHGCRYLHTPLRKVAHLEGDPDVWRRRWEAFFNLGHGESAVPADAEVVLLPDFAQRIRRDPACAPDARLVIEGKSFGYREMARPATLEPLRARLRAKYFAGDKSAIAVFRRAGAINVAVHLRRGDVGPDHFRYTPDTPMLAAIAQLQAVAGGLGRTLAIHLYSEGEPERFAPFAAAGCALRLDGDPFEAFHNLVAADLLVTTRSQFSRAAAMLSGGIALNPTDSWGPGRKWLARAPDGTFDPAALAALLS